MTARASRHGLKYLGEALFSDMQDHLYRPEVRDALRQSGDRIAHEQYLDFLNCRAFRQTLLCREGTPLTLTLGPEDVTRFHVHGKATPVSPAMDLRSEEPARFKNPAGVVVGMGTGTGVCTVLRTTDGGKSFSKVFESTTKSSLCWKVHYPSDKVGYVAVQDTTSGPATFAKTTDGGATWVEKPLPVQASAKGAFPAIGIGFIDERIGWVAPEDSKLPVYRTKDGGETWEVDPTLKAPINRFRFLDKNTGYAIGANVWKLTVPPTP